MTKGFIMYGNGQKNKIDNKKIKKMDAISIDIINLNLAKIKHMQDDQMIENRLKIINSFVK